MSSRETSHTCHAEQCEVHVPPKMFMCRRHWYMLPKALRGEVWLQYAVGQEMRMDPTPEYLNVAMRCVRFVAVKEGLVPAGDCPSPVADNENQADTDPNGAERSSWA